MLGCIEPWRSNCHMWNWLSTWLAARPRWWKVRQQFAGVCSPRCDIEKAAKKVQKHMCIRYILRKEFIEVFWKYFINDEGFYLLYSCFYQIKQNIPHFNSHSGKELIQITKSSTKFKKSTWCSIAQRVMAAASMTKRWSAARKTESAQMILQTQNCFIRYLKCPPLFRKLPLKGREELFALSLPLSRRE